MNPGLAARLAFLAAWASLGGLATTSCRTVHDIKVDAISASARPSGQAYRLIVQQPANLSVSEESQAGVTARIRTALARRGFHEAPAGTAPDIEITAAHGVGPAQLKFRYKPRDMLGIDLWGKLPPKGGAEPITVFEKYLKLSAHEATRSVGQRGEEVWSVHVSVEDEGKELEACLDALIAVLTDHIGEHVPAETMVRIKAEDASRSARHSPGG